MIQLLRFRCTAEVLAQALAKYGKPDIANTAQGSQFTPEDSTDVVNATKIFKPSLDDKGASRDNVFP